MPRVWPFDVLAIGLPASLRLAALTIFVWRSQMNEGSRKNPEQFARFFAALFRPDELVEMRFIESWSSKGKRRSRVAGPAKWIPAAQVIAEYDELFKFAESVRANIYFGVCPRPNVGDAVDQSIVTVRCVWCDIDDVTVEEVQPRWKAAEIPRPSIMVSSGNGVHAYWLLDEDLTSADEREHLVTMVPKFYAVFRGDHVQNLSRVMRPPGTVNYKGARNGKPPIPCSLVSCQPELRYPLSAFAPWLESAESRGRDRDDAPTANAKTESPLGTVLERHVDAVTLVSRLERPSQDRSRRDFAIVCDLLRLGLSPGEIWPLVAGSSKFESNGRSYFDVTIANAERTVSLDETAQCQPRTLT